MALNPSTSNSILHSTQTRTLGYMCFAVLLMLVLPNIALAQDATDTIAATCGFAGNVNKILNAVSIVVVTIAVIFSGYQIAFAHKRFGDIAPVMIGAVLIGAASQIANMFLRSSAGTSACSPTASLLTHYLSHYA